MEMIRPSGSHEWAYCKASHIMQEGLSNDESDATREGTAAHWVAEKIILSYLDTGDGELLLSCDLVDTLAPNDVYIDEEMVEGAMVYVRDVIKEASQHGLLQKLCVEQKLNLGIIYRGMEGTPDCWLYDEVRNELTVWDFKYGHGFVDAYQNPQLLIYALGIIENFITNIDTLSIKLRIVQPRCFSAETVVRDWEINTTVLREHTDRLKIAAQRAMFGGANAEPGTHCRYCRARFKCEALQKTTMNVIDVINRNAPQILEGNALAFEYSLLTRAMKLLQYRTDALKEQIIAEIKGGKQMTGWVLEQSYGRKKWSKELSTADIIADMDFWGIDVRKPDNIDTPTQVMGKIKKAKLPIEPSDIEQYIETPMTGFKIVEDTESKIRASFAKYINPEAIPNE